MLKTFAAIAFAGSVQAQTAMNMDYTATTCSLGESADKVVATTSATFNISELVNGANSYSIFNWTMNMTATTEFGWGVGSFLELAQCFPYTFAAGTGSITLTNYSCTYAYLADFTTANQPASVIVYNLGSEPKFGDSTSLGTQLEALVTAGSATVSCAMSYDFMTKDQTSTCYSPPITISASDSSYTDNAWTLGFQEAFIFDSEADQTTFKTATETSLAELGVAGMIGISDDLRYVNQGTYPVTLVSTSSGASAFAVAGATLAIFAVTF